MSAHWLLVANLMVALTILGAVAAPALRTAGFDTLSELIHAVSLVLCPQRPTHSPFLFGYQWALEQRELAMFGAQFAGPCRGPAPCTELDRRLLASSSLPIAWDGLSQTFRAGRKDRVARSWTGGLAVVSWLYPILDPVLGAAVQRETAKAA